MSEHRCEPGRTSVDEACTWHSSHYYCDSCEGFYGVPHDLRGVCGQPMLLQQAHWYCPDELFDAHIAKARDGGVR